MIKSTCEKIIIPVSRNTKTEIPILNMNRKKTVPKRLMVFVMVRLVFSLSSISSTTISSLSCPLFSSGLVESRRSTRSAPMLSTSELPYCSRSHGCLTCMENRLSRIKSTLSFPWLSEFGSTIFVPRVRLALLMSAENSLIFPI